MAQQRIGHRGRLAAAGLFVTGAAALAACGDDDSKDEPAASKTTSPTTLSVTTADAAKGFTMQAPSSIKGGLVQMRFENAGKAPHEAQLVRLDGGHTAQEALKLVDTDDAVKLPDWLHAEGGVAATDPGETDTVTENLPAGRYAILDTETGNDDKAPAPSRRGAIAEFTVTAGSDGALPATTSSIAVQDAGEDRYRFKATGLRAGTNKLLFRNESKSDVALHHVIAFPITPGKTIADVRKAFTARNPSGPPPLDFDNGTGTTVLDAGRELVTTMTLKKGSYALICFLNDRDETKPHFLEGLLTKVDVS
jgi:hypothetical protein